MKNHLLFLFLFFLPSFIFSQTIKGKITDNKNEPLAGATVYWLGTNTAASANAKGEFEISLENVTDKKLIISFVGYKSDTVLIVNENYFQHKLTETKTLKEVVVTGKKDDSYISTIEPAKIEVITANELTKGACCDLAGCFGTNASVTPTVTNIVTNSQELRILGLSGVYNQTLFDGLPLIQGLSFTYGISSIPGPMVDNIFVAKGMTSVLQGYESISGQMNVIPKDGNNADKLLLNVYVNSFFEKQFNGNYSTTIGKNKNWSNMFVAHVVQPSDKVDNDNDNFLDLPLLTRYMVFDKIKYREEKNFGWSSKIGASYLDEQRIGGQLNFDAATDKGSSTHYGQTVNITQPSVYTKTGYRFNDDVAVFFMGDYLTHSQNSWYGQTHYIAEQQSIYSNLQLELKYKEKHNFKVGVSYRNFNLNEKIMFSDNPLKKSFAGNYLKNETVPGVFAENIFNWNGLKYQLITGVRCDYHNQFGYIATPRVMFKFIPFAKTVLRVSGGTGWRTANIFSENINLLSSQRDIIFNETLKPEKAINYGGSIVQGFGKNNVEGTISADVYQTEFKNQIVPDYDTDPTKAFISNFTGPSISSGFQTDLSITFYKVLTFKAAYNYLDVYRMVEGKKITLPFNSLHKMLGTVSFKPKNEKWHADANYHWFGEQSLPNTSSLPKELQRPTKSESYSTLSVQFTKSWKLFELYFGCENVFNYRQEQPIISWKNPFSPYFDTSSVWGPTRGRELYVGIRFRLK